MLGNLAVNLALRYSFARRQFTNDPQKQEGGVEQSLINYQLQRHRLVPRMARAIAVRFAVERLAVMSKDNSPNSGDPTHPETALLHALSTFFKTYSSRNGHEDLQEAREAMGGLGYSYYSRLPRDLEDNEVNLTWEGDNQVILQQTSKFLLKALKAA